MIQMSTPSSNPFPPLCNRRCHWQVFDSAASPVPPPTVYTGAEGGCAPSGCVGGGFAGEGGSGAWKGRFALVVVVDGDVVCGT